MEQLWAPWRLEYVQHADDGGECVFCRAAGGRAGARRPPRRARKFPYSSGHLMVAPYRHGSGFDTLEEAQAAEVHRLAVEAIAALRTIFSPEGFNVGWNLGRVAGRKLAEVWPRA